MNAKNFVWAGSEKSIFRQIFFGKSDFVGWATISKPENPRKKGDTGKT
ncbi:MAG: hypothetical protein U5J82_06460 [Desulfobacterales bacterium]|nr:hypothetical protein [Desulfobacterales bacterium]